MSAGGCRRRRRGRLPGRRLLSGTGRWRQKDGPLQPELGDGGVTVLVVEQVVLDQPPDVFLPVPHDPVVFDLLEGPEGLRTLGGLVAGKSAVLTDEGAARLVAIGPGLDLLAYLFVEVAGVVEVELFPVK